MSKKLFSLISVLLIAAFVLSACASPAATTAAPAPTEAPAQPQPTTAPAATEAPAATTAPAATEAPAATTAPAAPAAPSGLKGSITLWQSWKETEIASLNDVVAAFQKTNPDVKFDILYVPFDDLRGKFETAASTGGGPTVLIGAADWGPAEFDANLVADISKDVNQDLLKTISPAALGAVQYKGALIGFPETVKGVVLYRNTKIIAQPAATMDDLIAAAKAATKGDVQGADWEYGSFFAMAALNSMGGQLMDDKGDPQFNSDKGVEWLNLFKKIKDAGIPLENNNDNDVNLFKAGKAGWIVDGTWNLSALSDAIGKENLAIDPWPTPYAGYTQTENIYLSANATADDAKAGLAFMEFFMSPEAQKLLSDPAKAGHIPAVSGVEVSDPLMKQAADALAKGVAFPVIPEMGAYFDPVNNAEKAVLVDGKDPKTELQSASDLVVQKIAEIRKK